MATLEDYFNENMESLGLPTVSNEAWKTSTGIVAWLNAVEKAVAKSPNATIGELIAGGVLADTLVVVAGVGAAFYAGAVAGSLMVAEAKLASDYISDVDWNIFNPGNYYGQYVSITTTQTSSGSRGTVLVGDIHDENGNVVNKLDFEWSNDGQSAPVDSSNGGTWQDPGAGSGGGSSGGGDSGGGDTGGGDSGGGDTGGGDSGGGDSGGGGGGGGGGPIQQEEEERIGPTEPHPDAQIHALVSAMAEFRQPGAGSGVAHGVTSEQLQAQLAVPSM